MGADQFVFVTEKLEMVGLAGDEDKLPVRSPAACSSVPAWRCALVLEPQIILCDDAPDSGLHPV
jgi:phospholipid/cholesterol/gamma-HCH transport system ATP-binding protein